MSEGQQPGWAYTVIDLSPRNPAAKHALMLQPPGAACCVEAKHFPSGASSTATGLRKRQQRPAPNSKRGTGMSEEARTPGEIAGDAIVINYEYYDGWFVYLGDGERLGPYPRKDDAEKVASSIVAFAAQAIRDAYERAATIAECYDNGQINTTTSSDMSWLIAAAIRALKSTP